MVDEQKRFQVLNPEEQKDIKSGTPATLDGNYQQPDLHDMAAPGTDCNGGDHASGACNGGDSPAHGCTKGESQGAVAGA